MKLNHLNNLAKLGDFLEEEVTDKQFDIEVYIGNGGFPIPYVNSHMDENCNTIGCALGWASCLFYDEAMKGSIRWCDFSKEMFDVSVFDQVGAYIFSSNWSKVPNQHTRLAAVKRIREVVKQKGKLTKEQKRICKVMYL